MFTLPQRLVFNEDVFKSLPDKKRSVFIYEWLCSLNKTLLINQKDDIRECQSQIVEQLLQLIPNGSNPSIRILISRNLAILFSTSDRSSLFNNTVNRCIGILKSNDEAIQLTAIVILGAFYEHFGRFLDRSYEETVLLLLKIFKNGDSHMRCEVLHTFEHIINGVGSAGRTVHRKIHKRAKMHLCDRVMSVRSAAAMCLIALINQNNSMYTNELEGNIASGIRAFEGANYEVRRSVAKYLAILLAASQDVFFSANQSKISNINHKNTIQVEKMLNYLSEGFRHGHRNLLKSNTTEQSKELTAVQHEIRAGITYTYIELIGILGTAWIEQNLSLLINHLIELAGNPRVSISHLDAISSRQCISLILRSLIGLHLNEKVQFILAKELTAIIIRCAIPQSIPNSTAILTNDSNISSMNSSTNSMTQSYGSTNQCESPPTECYENILVCALYELSLLIRSLEASTLLLLQDSCNGLIDTLLLVIRNPSQSVRILTAWCVRSITVVLPSLMTPLIDQCLRKMNDYASNTDAMSGFALILQALLGAVHQCPLGIPSQRVKRIFKLADNLLRTTIASTMGQEQSLILCLSLQRTSTAWYLLSACCTLDQDLRKKLLPRLILLWRNVFPRSTADFEQEKRRGDSLTWILSLNQRSGALCSMISFLNHCPTTEEHWPSNDLLERLMNPIENAISILFHTPTLIRQFGHQLKSSTTIFRLRLYELLLLIPSQSYKRHFKSLLRELMNEFTLVDSSLNLTTSLLKSICQENYHVLFGNWLGEIDYQLVEEQLHPHSTDALGALENDEMYLYRRDASSVSLNIVNHLFPSPSLVNDDCSNANYSRPVELNIPEPFPPNIAVIDASIRLFSNIFVHISNEHRLDTFQHLIDSIKQAKDAWQETIQINISAAVLLSLKTLVETEELSSFDDDDDRHLRKCACTLVIQTLSHSNPIVRCATAEALGRLIQIFPDDWLIENMIRFCFDHLKGSRDVSSQTGYSLGLACLCRHMDDLNKEQYLDLFISILHTVIKNQSTSIVQVWILHALNSIAQSSGDMLRSYVELLLELILDLLLSSPPWQIDIHRCCGRLLNTLIINIGPDLQINTSSISIIRSSCLTAINLLQTNIEPVVQAEAVQALQELHLFAPQHVYFSTLVPTIIKALVSRDLLLRRTCISCLRRSIQEEAKEVHKHAKLLFMSDSEQHSSSELLGFRTLEALLLSILDAETDAKVRSNIQKILLHILETVESNHLTDWLQLFGDILAEKSNMKSSSDIDHQTESFPKPSSNSNLNSDDDDDDDTNANEQLQTTIKENIAHCSTLSIKWQTKLFAIDCVQKILNYCEHTAQSHLHTYPSEDYLIAQLPTLMASSFLACRSIHDPLRLSGLSLLKQIILKSTHTNENTNSLGHVLLKQYQARIGAALRPAFTRRTPSHVTIHACDVCRIWILNETAWDLADWRRVHQLLISSLQKFTSIQEQFQNEGNMIYNETALTFENLAILKLWADIYNFAVEQRSSNPHCNLLLLIQSELYIVIHHWLAMLTDYVCLMLPKEFNSIDTMNSHRGNFYSTESDIDIIKRVYKTTWPSIMQAAVQWLVEHHYELEISPVNHTMINHRQRDILMKKLLTSTLGNKSRRFPAKKEDIFAMMLGCCVDALSISISEQTDETIERILVSFIHLLQSDITVSRITMEICTELVYVLHRLSVIRADVKIHLGILKALQIIFHHTTSTHFVINVDLCIPNESFLSAALNLLVSIFSNYFPVNQNNTTTFEVIELITSTIPLLRELITLCITNQNIQSSIPVILHLLLLNSFLLLSIVSNQQKQLLSQILQLIENLFSTLMSTTVLHTAMITIMNLRANLLEKDLSDNGYFVRCLTSLITHSNAIKVTPQMIDFYQKAFDDRNLETHLYILKCLNDLFQAKNIPLRNKFIRIFTPLLLIELKQTNNQPTLIEILAIFEKLLATIDSTSRLRLASLIIPILIHFLPNSTSPDVDTLTSYVTERLEYLLSIYPNEFRFIIETSSDLRSKLENTVARKQQKTN